jgi:serine/threonine protein kinase
MLWQPGKTLKNGAYTIEKVLGQGRFSVTYLACQATKNQFVAIKTLNPDASMLRDLKPFEREEFAVKFYDEAVKLGQCQHLHIVRVLEVFEEKNAGLVCHQSLCLHCHGVYRRD